MAESDRGGRSFRGIAYRQCPPHHAAISVATLDGSKRVGGRFNPPGEFGAVYVALDRQTATAELRRLAARDALPLDYLLPRVLLTVQVELYNLLDLTDAQVRQAWRITPEELAASDWTTCQTLARAARENGFEAIRFTSAAGTGQNLAIFLDRLEARSRVEVIASEELVLDRT